MNRLHFLDDDTQVQHVRELFREYLLWAYTRVNEEFGVNFEIDKMVDDDMRNLRIFLPPDGRIVLSESDGVVSGMGCLKKSKKAHGEIKRMYVRPAHRGKGLGKNILTALIDAARDVGYEFLRLDSTTFMTKAHSLYRGMGFRDCEPYPESDIPPSFRSRWVFMEMKL